MQCLAQLFVIYSYKYLMNIRDFNLNKNMGHVLAWCNSGVKLELVKLAEQWGPAIPPLIPELASLTWVTHGKYTFYFTFKGLQSETQPAVDQSYHFHVVSSGGHCLHHLSLYSLDFTAFDNKRHLSALVSEFRIYFRRYLLDSLNYWH